MWFKKKDRVEPPQPSDEELSSYYTEMMGLLLSLSDTEIAEVYLFLNGYEIHPLLKSLNFFKEKENTQGLHHDYWSAFTDIVDKILAPQVITKLHYKNLQKERLGTNVWGDGYVFRKNNSMK